MADFASNQAISGINAYGNGVPALRSAVNDVRDLAKILGDEHDYRRCCWTARRRSPV
jgi:hypothetical protein